MAVVDMNPETIPDWNLVVASAMTLFGLLSARDADKSSEQASV